MNRGLIFLDYLIELFMFMIKSEFINENPVVSLRKKSIKILELIPSFSTIIIDKNCQCFAEKKMSCH